MKMTITHLPEVQPNSNSFEVKSSLVQPALPNPNLMVTAIHQKAGITTLHYKKIITRSYYGFWKV